MSKDLNIKKTMLPLFTLLVESDAEARLGDNTWAAILEEMKPKTATAGTTTPREVTILKDVDGNVLGRQCTLSKKWFPISEFFKGTSVIKKLDQEKAKIYNEAKKLEKDADSIRDEAKTAETPEERLAIYDRYESALDEAKLARTKPVDAKIVKAEAKDGLDTIEQLAEQFGVVLGETANVPKVKETEATEEA